MYTSVEMIGTNREPPKKESALGSTILWKRLCSDATPSPTIIPPNTPICSDWMPQTEVIVPSSTSEAIVPSAAISPFTSSMPLIATFITKYAISADSAATSFSFFAIPIATPTAKINGRLSNTALPTLFIMISRAFRIVPSPRIPCRPYVAIVVSFVNELPIPRSSPATGRIAMGSIKDLPTL